MILRAMPVSPTTLDSHPSISSHGSSLSSLSYRPIHFALHNVPTNRTHDRYLQPISQYLRIDNDQSDLCMASPRNILPLLMSMTTMALPTVLSALSEYECTCERRYVAYVRGSGYLDLSMSSMMLVCSLGNSRLLGAYFILGLPKFK